MGAAGGARKGRLKKPIERISAGGATLGAKRILAVIGGFDEGTDPFIAAVRATRMPMIITSPRLPDNPVVFANDSFCRLTGYGRDEILGRTCPFLQRPETDPAVRDRIREALNGARSIEADIRNYRKNGEPFWNRLLMAPVRDANGDLAYFFASQVDVPMEREKLASLQTSNAAPLAELSGRLLDQQAREEELRFTLKAGRFGARPLDLASGECVSSPTRRETFGLDPERPCSYAELQEAVHAADRPRFEAATARNLA